MPNVSILIQTCPGSMSSPEIIIRVIVFLVLVNCLPVVTHMVLQERWRYPLDGGCTWRDGKPLLGKNKSVRGVIVGIAGGTAAYGLLMQPWWVAATASLLTMAGDLTSSFIKRRMGHPKGRSVFPLDQIFESLLPVLFLAPYMGLSIEQQLIILVLFVLTAYSSSRYLNYIIYRPPIADYPRIIRSTTRLREWRSCHVPLARYQTWLNLNRVLSDQVVLTWMFKLSGLYSRGMENAREIQLTTKEYYFDRLPKQFDNFRVLFLTDLHLDGLEGLTDNLIELVKNLEVDLCLLGGDIRMKLYGSIAPCIRELKRVIPEIRAHHGILGVLGNHDCIEMIPDFEEIGVIMLINDSWPIERDGQKIWIVGVDDPHYYKLDDVEQAFKEVIGDDFSLFLAHSPESFKKASRKGADLYLCGHTHGGQVCLSEKSPIITNSRAPRFTSLGDWRLGEMHGFTSRGVGASAIPIRFNCPGEICVLTLRSGKDTQLEKREKITQTTP